MISHCRDQYLLSTIVILFLIVGSELFFADMNGFPLNMIFAVRYRHYNFVGNTAWIFHVKQTNHFC